MASLNPDPREANSFRADKPFLGFFGQIRVFRIEKHAIGLHAFAADAAPQLIELGQAKIFGLFHHQGVHRGDVEAGFDNAGGEQDVVFSVEKIPHDFFQFGT
jgi:hypothetical protein